MRVALISDLHANEVALDAVLAELSAERVDRLVCLGDVATLGPAASAVLARLAALRCTCILGNHDEFLLEPELIHHYTEAPVIVQSVDQCRSELSAAELEQLGGFVRELDLDLGHGRRLLLFHGSPRSHMEDLLATTPPELLDERLDGRRATVMAGGHTHVQMLRQHRGDWLVNPGSVGLPFEAHVQGGPPTILAHAEYAVVEVTRQRLEVRLRRVELERSRLRSAALAWRNPLAPMLAAAYA